MRLNSHISSIAPLSRQENMDGSSILILILLLHGAGAATLSYLEEFRRLHECEYVDTAIVEFSHSNPGSTRRFTKREAIQSYRQGRENLRLTVSLASSKRLLELDVHRKIAIHEEALIVEHFGNRKRESRFKNEGCHYVGRFQNGGVVSLHICDGGVVAGGYDDIHEYVIYPHPQLQDFHGVNKNTMATRRKGRSADGENAPVNNKTSDENKTSISPEEAVQSVGDDSLSAEDVLTLRGEGHVMIAWRKIDLHSQWRDYQAVEKIRAPARSTRQASSEEQPSSSDDPSELFPISEDEGEIKNWERQGDSLRPSPLESADAEEANSKGGREKEAEDGSNRQTFTTEFAVVLDEDFVNSQKQRRGIRSDKDLVNFVGIKFNGVQAIYGNPDAVGLVMNIEVSRIDIFWKNPDWYKNQGEFNKSQLSRGATALRNSPDDSMRIYDLVAVSTQNVPGPPGVAFIGAICNRQFKTYVCKPTGLHWLCDAHEFGHTLGLNHDGEGCGDVKGIMVANPMMFLACYKEVLLQRAATAYSCLLERNVPTNPVFDFQTKKTFTVLTQGLDKLCETDFIHGSENVRQLHDGPCPSIACAVLNQEDEYFGVMTTLPFDAVSIGRVCGSNKVCFQDGQCKDVNPKQSTTISLNAYYENRRLGGWSEWSSYSDTCSSGCGTGLRVAARSCNKPPPVMDYYCPGSKFKAVVCNMKPCPGEDFKNAWELKQDRAAYMCRWLIRRYVLDKNKYISAGDVVNERGDGTRSSLPTVHLPGPSVGLLWPELSLFRMLLLANV